MEAETQNTRVLTEGASRGQPVPSPSTIRLGGFAEDLNTTILRSQKNLLGLQKPEGYWVGELMVDSTLVSDMVAFHHWDGSVDKDLQMLKDLGLDPCWDDHGFKDQEGRGCGI